MTPVAHAAKALDATHARRVGRVGFVVSFFVPAVRDVEALAETLAHLVPGFAVWVACVGWVGEWGVDGVRYGGERKGKERGREDVRTTGSFGAASTLCGRASQSKRLEKRS